MAGAPGKGGEAARPIIVKRIKKGGGGHHGGAWKIAYADFVTAMMAFFLLMWLLGSTAKGDLAGIAMYFQSPLQVAMRGGSGAGDASSVITGGGQDLTRQAGQVRRGDIDAVNKTYALKAAKAEFERQEFAQLKSLKEKVDDQINATPGLQEFKSQIRTDMTSEGLRIQIVDDKDRPTFGLASAQPEEYTRQILHEVAKSLNAVPNHISISGHTDARPYGGGERGYNNWDLSTDRANLAHRELVAGGLDADRVIRIVGLGSTSMLYPDDPLDPRNRRISIVVMNRKTEDAIRKDGSVTASDGDETSDVLEGKRIPSIVPALPSIGPQRTDPFGKTVPSPAPATHAGQLGGTPATDGKVALAPPRLELTPGNPSRK